jgi:predicted DNA-binding transcriptional regulator AlpA
MNPNLNSTSVRLVDSVELKKLGVINSRTSLHRYLHREPNRNPFPQPLRHTETGRRYWREGDVAQWLERENRRRRITLDDPKLVNDTDPRAWMPKFGQQGGLVGNTIATAVVMAPNPHIG